MRRRAARHLPLPCLTKQDEPRGRWVAVPAQDGSQRVPATRPGRVAEAWKGARRGRGRRCGIVGRVHRARRGCRIPGSAKIGREADFRAGAAGPLRGEGVVAGVAGAWPALFLPSRRPARRPPSRAPDCHCGRPPGRGAPPDGHAAPPRVGRHDPRRRLLPPVAHAGRLPASVLVGRPPYVARCRRRRRRRRLCAGRSAQAGRGGARDEGTV